MKKLLQKFHRDDEGATMVEYAIMVALIAVISIAVVAVLGKQVSNVFSLVSSYMTGT